MKGIKLPKYNTWFYPYEQLGEYNLEKLRNDYFVKGNLNS